MTVRGSAGKIALIGLLSALAVALSLAESLIPPVPMMPPGARLGLSNVCVMFAAGTLGFPATIFIAVSKGVFALLTRGLTAGMMSLFAGCASASAMYLLFRKTSASICIIAVFGSLVHNAVQLALAYFITSAGVLLFIPSLLIIAVATGILTGLVLKVVLPVLETASILFMTDLPKKK